jgi:hypothetical protein
MFLNGTTGYVSGMNISFPDVLSVEFSSMLFPIFLAMIVISLYEKLF